MTAMQATTLFVSRTVRLGGCRLFLSTGLVLVPAIAMAVEGGTGAYLLGSRDTFAGIAPPPGLYFSLDALQLEGSVPVLPISGVALTDARTRATIYKLNFTQSFSGTLWGGRPFLTLTIPVVSGELQFSGELKSGLAGGFTDSDTGFGDLTLTPSIGYHQGPHHWVYAASIFAPTGFYEPGSVDIPGREIQALSFGKNRWAVMPTVAYTYFNPTSGFEFSAVGGVTFSQRNDATDYQSAPEASLEMTVMQHLPSGWALGLTGYGYQQIGDDSGSGAEKLRSLTNAETLSASVFGLGPIITFNTKIDGRAVGFKVKYITEFEAERRFQSDVLTGSVNISF